MASAVVRRESVFVLERGRERVEGCIHINFPNTARQNH